MKSLRTFLIFLVEYCSVYSKWHIHAQVYFLFYFSLPCLLVLIPGWRAEAVIKTEVIMLNIVTITSWSAPKSHQSALHIRLITSQISNSHNASYLGLIAHCHTHLHLIQTLHINHTQTEDHCEVLICLGFLFIWFWSWTVSSSVRLLSAWPDLDCSWTFDYCCLPPNSACCLDYPCCLIYVALSTLFDPACTILLIKSCKWIPLCLCHHNKYSALYHRNKLHLNIQIYT